MKKSLIYLSIVLILTALSGCNGYEKLLKSNDFDAKYEAAMNYYNQKSYSKAVQLFENLVLYYRGKDKAENIAWYYCQSLYQSKDYYPAGYQFRNFTRQYPFSEHAEEAYYLAAVCMFEESPEYNVDQTVTKEAIATMEQFVDRYPHSVRIPEVNNYLDQLRGKLMRKDYEIAYGYYRVEQYHAAYTALNAFLNNYPDSPNREDAMYYVILSGYEYAVNSREDKVKERLNLVVNDFDKFATLFKESKYLASAQNIYTKSKAKLAEIEQKEKNITK